MTSDTASPAYQLQEIRDLIASFESHPGASHGKTYPWLISNTLDQSRVILFQGSHGFAASLPDLDKNYAASVVEGNAKVNRLCQAGNLDLRLYEMDVEHPSRNCLDGPPAMGMDETVKALAYGMMAVEPGLHMVAAGAFGRGSDISAKAILQSHAIAQFDDLNAARLIKANGNKKGFECLSQIGGFEIAALCGLIIAARLANISVLAEGFTGAAALALLNHEQPGSLTNCALTGVQMKDIATKMGLPSFELPQRFSKAEPGTAAAYLIPQIRNDLIMSQS